MFLNILRKTENSFYCSSSWDGKHWKESEIKEKQPNENQGTGTQQLQLVLNTAPALGDWLFPIFWLRSPGGTTKTASVKTTCEFSA